MASTLFVAPTASAAESRVLGGMSLNNVDDLKKLGVTPDLGSTWLGPWSKNNWGGVDSTLRSARDKGVTPVIQWYYWGDDISPNCVANGCWSSLHNTYKSRADWNAMAETVAKKIRANLGDRQAIVVLETEFNKGGIETWEPFDGYLEAQAKIFRAHAPNAVLVLGFGSWGHQHYKNFDRAIAATDWLGFQDLAGSTRDSDATMRGSVQKLIDTSRFLHNTWGKPTFLAHWAVSTYPEPKYLWIQEEQVKELFRRMGELEAAGLKGFLYRDLRDHPGFDLANYYGIAERHWGLMRADYSHKPALDDWIAGLKMIKNAGTKKVPGLVEAETFGASTTGKSVYDSSASGSRSWLLWSNGHVETRVASTTTGEHAFTFRASGTPAAGGWPVMVASLDGKEIGRWTVSSEGYKSFTAKASLTAGAAATLRVAYVNDLYANGQDRNLKFDKVDVATSTTSAAPTTSPTPVTGLAAEAESMSVKTTGGRMVDSRASGGAAWNLWSNGHVQERFQVPATGEYKVTIKAKGTPAAGTWPLMVLLVDGKEVQRFSVRTQDAYWSYGALVPLTAGGHDVRVAFVNDLRTSSEDRNLRVDVVTLQQAASSGAVSGTLEAESMSVKTTGGRMGDSRASGGAAWNLWSNGHVADKIVTSKNGNVEFTVKAKGTPAAGESPFMALVVDGKKHYYRVNARDAYWDYRASIWLPAGEHNVQVEFLNDLRTSTEDRNLHVDAVHWRVQ